MASQFLDNTGLMRLLTKMKAALVAPFVKDIGSDTAKIQLGSAGTDISLVNTTTSWNNSSIGGTGHLVAAYKYGNDSVHRLVKAENTTVGNSVNSNMVDYCHIAIAGETQDASHTHTIYLY